MDLQRILQAAVNSLQQGKRAPHCGQPATLNDAENVNWSAEYAEPGYSTPAKGIVFADWNGFPKDFDRVLERAGYAVEWSDEWATCEDCYRAFRTQPSHMDWRPIYSWDGDCSLVCRDCLQDRYPTSEDLES